MIRLVFIVFLCVAPLFSYASTDLFVMIGEEHGVNPLLIRTIAEVESDLNPWALNINRESADCTTKVEAIEGLNYVYTRPWLIRVPVGTYKNVLKVKSELNCVLKFNSSAHSYERLWFQSEAELNEFVDSYGIKGEKKKINPESTDIGYMQVNWYYHKDRVGDPELLFNPAFNVSYGAKYLRSLIEKYGSIYDAIGKYHNKTNRSRQDEYRQRIIERFYKLKKNI